MGGSLPAVLTRGSSDFALTFAKERCDWYHNAARTARFGYLATELLMVVLGAAVPLAAALESSVRLMAALGAAIVVLTGIRGIFQWHENWLGFIDAQMDIETEMALYQARYAPYADEDRGERLMRNVEDIRIRETRQCVSAVAGRRRSRTRPRRRTTRGRTAQRPGSARTTTCAARESRERGD